LLSIACSPSNYSKPMGCWLRTALVQ
jgi:hypothetical protein